ACPRVAWLLDLTQRGARRRRGWGAGGGGGEGGEAVRPRRSLEPVGEQAERVEVARRETPFERARPFGKPGHEFCLEGHELRLLAPRPGRRGGRLRIGGRVSGLGRLQILLDCSEQRLGVDR